MKIFNKFYRIIILFLIGGIINGLWNNRLDTIIVDILLIIIIWDLNNGKKIIGLLIKEE